MIGDEPVMCDPEPLADRVDSGKVCVALARVRMDEGEAVLAMFRGVAVEAATDDTTMAGRA